MHSSVGGVLSSGRFNCHRLSAVGAKSYSDNGAPTKSAWTENLGADCIADVMLLGRSVLLYQKHGKWHILCPRFVATPKNR